MVKDKIIRMQFEGMVKKYGIKIAKELILKKYYITI